MPDVLDQIQQRQTRAQNQQLAAAQRNVDWNATFGRMAPEEVLRATRDFAALKNMAIERKMALAAQTSEEAQRIYINDRKFKAWEQSQPLRDDLLKAQIADETASESARAAQELLATSRKEREARSLEQSALAQWELDQLEESPRPEAEKRAWLNTVRGRYPSMDKAAIDRFESINGRLNPDKTIAQIEAEAAARARGAAVTDKTPAQIEAEAAARARGTESAKPEKDTVLPSLEKERDMNVRMLDRAKRIRAKAFDPSVIADADADIRDIEKTLTDVESQIRTLRTGASPATPAAAPAANPNQAALDWLSANPNDPRAPAVRAKLGIK